MLFGLLTKARRPSSAPSRRAAYCPQVEALEDRLCPSGGLLDPTFGGTGEVNLAPSVSGLSFSVAIQPQDGKIVSVGRVTGKSSIDEISVVRMNADGSLDASFNGTGYEALKVGYYSDGASVALQPDGKILVGGSAYASLKAFQNHDTEIVVARLNSNGTLDSTFANRGVFTWDRTSGSDVVSSLAVLSDGSIAAAGQNIVFKLSASGALVSSFGSGGAYVFQAVTGTFLGGMAVAPNGDIIVSGKGGNTNWNGVGILLVVNPSTGGLDPSFNNGQGWVAASTPAGGITEFNAVTIQGNGIVAAGNNQIRYQGQFGLLGRFSLSGALDTSFASGGYFTTTGTMNLFNVAPELDGSLVVAGRDGTGTTLPVGHFTAGGQLDTTFGGAGTGFNVIQSASTWGGLAIGADGRIVVCGFGLTSPSPAFFARLTPPEAMIGLFTASANPVTAGSSETLTASNIANSSTITQVAFYAQVNGSNTLLGYGTQSSPGVWTFSFTVNLAPGTYTLFAQTEDSYGVFGDLAALTLTVQ
jgi:uncharacterized delta-60 repeat protein